MKNLKLINNRIDNEPFPFVVMCFVDFFNQSPTLVERWQTKEEAIHCGKNRQSEGYIVQVMKELAHSISDV